MTRITVGDVVVMKEEGFYTIQFEKGAVKVTERELEDFMTAAKVYQQKEAKAKRERLDDFEKF